jgi:hypothetical protein
MEVSLTFFYGVEGIWGSSVIVYSIWVSVNTKVKSESA